MTTETIIWTRDDMILAACEHWGDGFEPADCTVIMGDCRGESCVVVRHEPTGRTSDESGPAGCWNLDGMACAF